MGPRESIVQKELWIPVPNQAAVPCATKVTPQADRLRWPRSVTLVGGHCRDRVLERLETFWTTRHELPDPFDSAWVVSRHDIDENQVRHLFGVGGGEQERHQTPEGSADDNDGWPDVGGCPFGI
jgi:hypothetical protein